LDRLQRVHGGRALPRPCHLRGWHRRRMPGGARCHRRATEGGMRSVLDRPFVDWHTHIFRPEHCGPVWTDRGTELVGRPAFGEADLAEHTRVMDEAGVDKFALIGLQISKMGMFVPNDYIGG